MFNTHFYIDDSGHLRMTEVHHNERGYRVVAPLVSKDMSTSKRSAWSSTKSIEQVYKTLDNIRVNHYAPDLKSLMENRQVTQCLIESPIEVLKAYTAWTEYEEPFEYFEICEYLIKQLESSNVENKENKINHLKEVK